MNIYDCQQLIKARKLCEIQKLKYRIRTILRWLKSDLTRLPLVFLLKVILLLKLMFRPSPKQSYHTEGKNTAETQQSGFQKQLNIHEK